MKKILEDHSRQSLNPSTGKSQTTALIMIIISMDAATNARIAPKEEFSLDFQRNSCTDTYIFLFNGNHNALDTLNLYVNDLENTNIVRYS